MQPQTLAWVLFFVIITVMLVIDLGVFQKKPHAVKPQEALIWTSIWVALSLCFCAGIYLWHGATPALEFLTGYVVEKSLSLDNIFVFVMIFQFFRVPIAYQHRVLFFGILGAVLMRGLFIWGGLEIVQTFSWTFYIFGLFLIFTAVKMMCVEEDSASFEDNKVLGFLKKHLPLTADFQGSRFFVTLDGRKMATPLFMVLIFIELSDVLFAFDSVPAIFAITTDSFIVFTSNIFAILGLRSMYFLLADLIPKFHYLKAGISIILLFIGIKLLGHGFIDLPIWVSLGVILGVLCASILLSIIKTRRHSKQFP